MKILLDHNLDWRLSRHMPGHEVKSASEMRWADLANGRLLSEAEMAGFQVLLSGDININYQQNIVGRTISIVVLKARNNRGKTHLEMMPEVLRILETIQPGQTVVVVHPDLKD